MSKGGVEVIVAAARAHSGSADVSNYVCLALASLAVDAANEVSFLKSDSRRKICISHERSLSNDYAVW